MPRKSKSSCEGAMFPSLSAALQPGAKLAEEKKGKTTGNAICSTKENG